METPKIDPKQTGAQIMFIEMANAGFFKTTELDDDMIQYDGYCDKIFFQAKCYKKPVNDMIKKFVTEKGIKDGRFKLEKAVFLLDYMADGKMFLMLREASGPSENIKKEQTNRR